MPGPGRRQDLRNVAIIAHVDHGKTTLVDAMLKATGSLTAKDPQEQALDSIQLERERGITILSKATSVPYRGTTINIVDTPGHADFGSEVERILGMVDGALLLVDAVEGPMPQTRFVLRKALALGLRPIVVINKMDRPRSRPGEVLDKVFGLFIDLGATDPQLEFPILYAAGKEGWASLSQEERGGGLEPLFETILSAVPGPLADPSRPFRMLVTMLDSSSYVGQIGIGRIQFGRIAQGAQAAVVKPSGEILPGRVRLLEKFSGLGRREVPEAQAGDIVALALEGLSVGDTVASPESPEALPPLAIDEPTMAMEFLANTSPFAGREGRFVTSRHLRERLLKEQQVNVGLRVEALEGEGRFRVSGRGELHLSILIETMRREGYELAVSRPEVIYKSDEQGGLLEPVEHLVVDSPSECQGSAIESLGRRGGRMLNINPEGTQRVRIEYLVSSRGLMGFKSELMNLTRGLGLMHHSFQGYAPKGADPAPRPTGVLVAKEKGTTTTYALYGLQERGVLLLGPGTEVYEGMIVGIHNRANDLVVNPCKAKALSNVRSKASDEALVLSPFLSLTLEQALEFIGEGELVEATPKAIRLRKKILSASLRRRAERSQEAQEGE